MSPLIEVTDLAVTFGKVGSKIRSSVDTVQL
jgi:hypothetical protein